MGFGVMASSDVPDGYSLTLQIKGDNEESFGNYASSVVAKQRVTVTSVTGCRHYALRWQTARTASAWLWVTTSCAEGQTPPSRLNWAPAAQAGYIVGQVLDAHTDDPNDPATQTPVEGVTLWAEGYETGSYVEAMSDVFGRFQLGPLEAGGGYAISAFSEDYSYNKLEDIVVPAEGLVLPLLLARTGAVHGHIVDIVDTDENDIIGAQVQFIALGDSDMPRPWVQTDSNGQFCICSLNASSAGDIDGHSYQIIVSHPDHSTIEVTRQVVPRYQRTDEVELKEVMKARGILEGTVNVDSVAQSGVWVWVRQSVASLVIDSSMSDAVQTNSSGQFSFSLSAPATYQLLIQGAGTTTETLPVDVEVGPNAPLDPIELQGPGKINGVVVDLNSPNNAPLAGVPVELRTQGAGGPAAEPVVSDSEGHFRFLDLSPGNYFVCVGSTPNRTYMQFPRVRDVEVATGQEATPVLRLDSVKPLVSIEEPVASPPQTVSGVVQVLAQVSDNQGVDSVDLLVDNIDIETIVLSDPDADPSLWVVEQAVSFWWDSTAVTNGSHLLTVNVDDMAGNHTAATVTVMVDNQGPIV